MRRVTRRSLLGLAALGGASLVAMRFALPRWMRAGPVRAVEELSPAAQALVARAFDGLDPARVWDCHVHLLGIGTGGSGCWVNPAMRSQLHVIRRVQYELTMAASGAWREETLDQDYLERLLALQRAANPEGRAVLFAYDWTVDPYGRERPERTAMHTPNEYALRVAREHEEALACASVHPYRRDAVERLERAAEEGAVAVKWLPNAMGIDPASALCDAFYAKLAELGLPLLCHAGLELAVPGAEAELGNPLRLRRALEHGVRVVVAHCASAGSAYDLDAPGSRGRVSCFELFLRMMGEERWRGQLFGDVSALSVVNRCGAPLRRLIQAEGLHARLVNGSDYPLTAIDPAVSTRLLQLRGYLSGEDRAACEEVFDANPLLFDLVLKRSLAVAEGDGGGMRRFAAGVFESARVLG